MGFIYSIRNAKFKTRYHPRGTLVKWGRQKSYEYEYVKETNHLVSDSSSNDKPSLQIGSRPPHLLPDSTIIIYRPVNKDKTTDDTAKPSQSQRKWKLGEDETRGDTGSHRRRRKIASMADAVLLNALSPNNPDIDRTQGSPPSTPDSLSSLELPNFAAPVGSSVNPLGPDSFDITGSSRDTLDARRREQYSAETTTAWSISVKSTISEDLSRDDKDRGAKLRYLQKRHERQTLGLYRV